jgi:CotS family spore coat protein
MQDISIQVFKEFGITTTKIVKEKSNYICTTDKGMKIIKKGIYKKDNIQFQHEIKEHLHSVGFSNIDRFDVSTNGKPYVIQGETTYIMTDFFKHRETDFTNKEDLYLVTKNLALMHKKANGVKFSGKIFYKDNILNDTEKEISELYQIKKNIVKEKRLSDFDVMFIKNYDFYKHKLEFCSDNFKTNKYNDFIQSAKKNNCIIHNMIKEENFLHSDDGLNIIEFSRARVDYFIVDVCALIQRYIKRMPQDYYEIYKILEIYSKYNDLGKKDIEMLYDLLKYPSKFIKICNQYYSKKRTWTPNAIINRMESIISSKDTYENYIDELKLILK